VAGPVDSFTSSSRSAKGPRRSNETNAKRIAPSNQNLTPGNRRFRPQRVVNRPSRASNLWQLTLQERALLIGLPQADNSGEITLTRRIGAARPRPINEVTSVVMVFRTRQASARRSRKIGKSGTHSSELHLAPSGCKAIPGPSRALKRLPLQAGATGPTYNTVSAPTHAVLKAKDWQCFHPYYLW